MWGDPNCGLSSPVNWNIFLTSAKQAFGVANKVAIRNVTYMLQEIQNNFSHYIFPYVLI